MWTSNAVSLAGCHVPNHSVKTFCHARRTPEALLAGSLSRRKFVAHSVCRHRFPSVPVLFCSTARFDAASIFPSFKGQSSRSTRYDASTHRLTYSSGLTEDSCCSLQTVSDSVLDHNFQTTLPYRPERKVRCQHSALLVEPPFCPTARSMTQL